MNSAIIVAAGKGTRMGPGVDKLFLNLAGKPVVCHTWKTFNDAACIDEIILVVRAGMEQEFETLAGQFGFDKPHKIVAGGTERQDSVWNGLQAVSKQTEVVAIQDGARPCTTEALINATIGAARAGGAAVAASRVVDTIKQSEDGKTIGEHLQREKLWAVQTPQAFRLDVVLRAMEAVRQRGLNITDDTAACELIGQKVTLVESPSPNPKLTSPGDISCLEGLLN